MMHIEDLEALGFKQMHRVQVNAVMGFVEIALNLAVLADDENILEETEFAADELVRLFGGAGVAVRVDRS